MGKKKVCWASSLSRRYPIIRDASKKNPTSRWGWDVSEGQGRGDDDPPPKKSRHEAPTVLQFLCIFPLG